MKEIKIKNVNETVYEHTCKNGLKVYLWKYDLSSEVSMTLTVKYGSIHTDFMIDSKKVHVPNGVAHFLEHLKFNEDNNHTAHEYFYKLGSYTNAYTTYDHTLYEVTCTDNIKDNLEHLLYFVLNPYFTKSLVNKEKPIIIEEAKSTLDNPYNLGFFKLLNNIYYDNHHKYMITGSPEEIKTITIEDIENVFNAFYHPKNMFLTVTGDINPYEIEKIVDEFFNNFKVSKYLEPKVIVNKEPNTTVKNKEVLNANVTKEKLLLGFKIPKKIYKNIDELNLRILFNILLDINFDMTSSFNEDLIKNNIIDDLYYTVNIDETHILILFESSTSYPGEVINKLKDKMKNLDIIENDFQRKIKMHIAQSILGYEKANIVNSDIVSDVIKYGHIINNIDEVYHSLSINDLKEIYSKIKYETSELILKPNN